MKCTVKKYGQKSKTPASKVSLGNLPTLKMSDPTARPRAASVNSGGLSVSAIKKNEVRELSFPQLNYANLTGKDASINGTSLQDHLISLECRKFL